MQIIAETPGLKPGELFVRSATTDYPEQVWKGLHRLRRDGLIEKWGRGYRITDAGKAHVPPAEVPDAEEARGDGRGDTLPPVPDPDRPSALPKPTVRTCEPTGAVFAAFLSALLAACKADSNAALRALAEGVEEHAPEDLL